MQNLMRTRAWVVAAALLACTAAEAQTKPFRADGGVQSATQSGWTGANGVPGLYYKVSSGWWVRKPDNSEIGPLGVGGGASTLALLYAAGASGTDSTFSLDSTRLQLKILAPASALGTLFSIRNNADSNSFIQITDNSTQLIKSSIADGASSVGTSIDTTNTLANATSKILKLSQGGTERFSLTGPGNVNLTVNATLQLLAQAATNTVGLTIKPNAADGATTVNLAIDDGTACVTSGCRLLSLREGGSEKLYFDFVNNRVWFTSGSSGSFGNSAVALNFTGTSLQTVGHLTPASDATYQFGDPTLRWIGAYSLRFANGVSQNKSFSATPAFDCTLGNFIHIGTITANVTGPTMAAGSPGERCTIVFLKDGTAGTYSVAGWGSNVRFNGSTSFTSGAGSLMIWNFIWDDRLATPAWVQTSNTAVFN